MRQQVLVVGDGAAQTVQLFLDLVAPGQPGGAVDSRMAVVCSGVKPKRSIRRPLASESVCEERIMLMTSSIWSRATSSPRGYGHVSLKVKASATGDDVDLVVDVVLQHLAQAQAFGNAVDECQVVGAKGRLQRGVLIQVVEHDLRNDALLGAR